jgi:hypothetical protein
MSSRLVPVLLMAAMLYALGAGISSLPWHPAKASKAHAATPPAAAAPASSDIPVLPTVVVRPDGALAALLPTVSLPTVSVRPSPAEMAAARAIDARALGTGAVVVALHTLGGGMAPRSGLDMPYYSFGKSVYRLRKE